MGADVLPLRFDGWLGSEGARDGHAAARGVRQGERKAVRRVTPHDVDGDAALSRWLGENGLEGAVDVAIEQCARLDGRHACSDDAPTLSPIHSEAFKLTARVEEDQPVTIVEQLCAIYDESAATIRTGAPKGFADRFGRVERGDVEPAPMEEIVGEAAVEALLRPWLEGVGGSPVGRPSERRIARQNLVESLAIVSGDILHVGHVFQSALDLERGDAGGNHGLEVVRTVHIAERKQVLVLGYRPSVCVDHRVGQSATLRACAAVGAASGEGRAEVTSAAVADT